MGFRVSGFQGFRGFRVGGRGGGGGVMFRLGRSKKELELRSATNPNTLTILKP